MERGSSPSFLFPSIAIIYFPFLDIIYLISAIWTLSRNGDGGMFVSGDVCLATAKISYAKDRYAKLGGAQLFQLADVSEGW
jgi:hypothetical protein